MLKNLRSAVVAFTACFAMAAGAQGTVTLGQDGSIQVTKGNKTVTLEGGKINAQKGDKKVELEGGKIDAQRGEDKVQLQGAQVQTGEDEDDSSAGTVESSGSKIEINGTSRKETIRCGPQSHVEVNGTSHELTLIGECEYVEVNGTSNSVKVEAASTIEVNGMHNSVTWKRGVGAAKPKVSRSGLKNKVSQEK